jgi:hypothetical protein
VALRISEGNHKGDERMSEISYADGVRKQRVSEFIPPKHRAPPPLPTTAIIPLSEGHRHDLEATLMHYKNIETERDDLRKEVSNLTTKLAAAEAVVQMMESNVTASESRVTSYQLERDKAVADRAKWETLVLLVRTQLNAALENPPTEMLVTMSETDDERPAST